MLKINIAITRVLCNQNKKFFDFLDKKIKEEELAKGNFDTSLADFLEKSIQETSCKMCNSSEYNKKNN